MTPLYYTSLAGGLVLRAYTIGLTVARVVGGYSRGP